MVAVAQKRGRISKAEIMRQAGYSPATATHPKKLTNSKGWNKLLEKQMPDEYLVKKHNEALEATKVISARITSKEANEGTDDFIEVPDHKVRLEAVKLGYQIKGHLQDNHTNVQVNGEKVLVIPSELVTKYDT